MTKRVRFKMTEFGSFATAVLLACTVFGCFRTKDDGLGSSERDSGTEQSDAHTKGIAGRQNGASGIGGSAKNTSGSGAADFSNSGIAGFGAGGSTRIDSGDGAGGVSGSGDGEIDACPYTDPPFADPYCYNEVCPTASITSISATNRPMGDCCNTVDIKRLEESMAPGERYDLKLAILINLNQTNPHLTNAIVQGLFRNSQEQRENVMLIRIKDVPRTADMNKGEMVTVEFGSGRFDCKGYYSFYGPNAAVAPRNDGPPNDPGRWVKRELDAEYNGFNAKVLLTPPSEETIASATGLIWLPSWKDGHLDFEEPVEFLSFVMENDPSNPSCYGTIDSSGEWTLKSRVTFFVPVSEAKLTLRPDLSLQSHCGFLAKGPLQGECDEPQANWSTKPTGYCDEEHRCWIGDPSDREYRDFWDRFYSGALDCGDAHPCCDPAGEDPTLEPCNAFYMRNAAVIAAVNITADDLDDPSRASSGLSNCL